MTRSGLSSTLSRLNAEWEALQHTPAPEDPAARTCGEVLTAIRPNPDEELLALLERQGAGSQQAGRIVVQALLPKLVLMAVRDPDADLDDYLGALWITLATYPLARRPRRVAANLVLDTLKAVKGTRPRAVPMGEVVVPAGGAAAVLDPLAEASAVLDAGVRLGLIDDLTCWTLRTVYVAGRSSRAASEVLGVSPESVRWRCSKGVRALRAAADALADQVAA
ncbi:MAG: hypothetical protein Q4F65_11685 [Propionibacteriaceae bacterium]|nr:hypothetical protein [Propionibacteriaceae bacterium]